MDWSGCKDKPEGRVIWINLATKQGIDELKDILKANIGTLKVVFMSPPLHGLAGPRNQTLKA